METLLKASAYMLGTSNSSIVYKAITRNGATFAVRRIVNCCVKKMKDFETQIRVIAKLRHPNLVRTLGFYWCKDEKLVIYDLVPNGSLASAINRKSETSAIDLNLAMPMRIARGVARGLACIWISPFASLLNMKSRRHQLEGALMADGERKVVGVGFGDDTGMPCTDIIMIPASHKSVSYVYDTWL